MLIRRLGDSSFFSATFTFIFVWYYIFMTNPRIPVFARRVPSMRNHKSQCNFGISN